MCPTLVFQLMKTGFGAFAPDLTFQLMNKFGRRLRGAVAHADTQKSSTPWAAKTGVRANERILGTSSGNRVKIEPYNIYIYISREFMCTLLHRS